MILPIVVAVCFALVAYQALRRPVLRRLAVRDALRRPGETALVIAGSLLGTALITGSFIVGDTLDSSITTTAHTQLGPVDEIVTAPDPSTAEKLARAVAQRDDARVDGVMTIMVVQSAIVSHASGDKRAEPGAQMIEMNLEEARSFGDDPVATGISGPTPSAGEIVITQDLAESTEAGPGDRVTAFVYRRELRFTVNRVLPTLGLAGFWTGFESTSPNGFVAPGTLAEATPDPLPPGVAPPAPTVLVSNRGGVEDGAALSDGVTELIESLFPTGSSLRVERVKQDTLDAAREQGDAFAEVFVGIGSFAIIAGVLLLVNIFVMLAEERKSQLGMLRAVGMRRSHLVRAFVIEGALYSFTAGLFGAGLGIGVGWAIVKLAAPIFGAFGDFALDLRFDFEGASIVTGFCAGVLISLFTVFFTSLRISRINIIRAIRDLPEPVSYRVRTATVVLGLLFAGLSVAGFVTSLGRSEAWAIAILGPPFALLGLLPFASRLMPRRIAVLIAASLALTWGVLGNRILDGQFFGRGEIFAFVIQGVLLTFSAVMLLTQGQETLEGGIRRIAARRLPLRLSIAYPLARRFRTGLTLGMFALVIFTMTFIATLSNVFGGQVEATTAKEGDFEILVTSNISNPPSAEEIAAQEGVEGVSGLLVGAALFQPASEPAPEPWPISGIDRSFVEGGPPNLTERSEGMTSDREAWDAVVSDPTNMIVPSFFLQEGGGPPSELVVPGDEVEVIDPVTGRTASRTIVGLVENDFAFSGSYVSKSSMREVLGARAAAARFYVQASDDPNEANEVADRLEARFVPNGLEAQSFRALVEEFQRANLQFFQLMQGYLALGLLVGIAGLGVVMVRAVRERRRDVGVLRSLGFLIHQVRRAFVLESAFVAFEGIVVGAVLAIVTSSQLVASGEFGEDIAFELPWLDLGVLTVAALLASLLATAWPSHQASQIPPAAALRIAD
ncbi:MAG: ABC transporter permease [Actinomycetota bacterium]|nr:ABC transporter permease [Actinomycetota bacterium]